MVVIEKIIYFATAKRQIEQSRRDNLGDFDSDRFLQILETTIGMIKEEVAKIVMRETGKVIDFNNARDEIERKRIDEGLDTTHETRFVRSQSVVRYSDEYSEKVLVFKDFYIRN